MQPKVYYEYLQVNDAALFTAICLPQGNGPFPTVIFRNPYVDETEHQEESEICAKLARDHESFLSNAAATMF